MTKIISHHISADAEKLARKLMQDQMFLLLEKFLDQPITEQSAVDIADKIEAVADEYANAYGSVEYVSYESRDVLKFFASQTTFSSATDGDTQLQAAAREAGWALTELVDSIDWTKREKVSGIITRLGIALSEPATEPAPSPDAVKIEPVGYVSSDTLKRGSGELLGESYVVRHRDDHFTHPLFGQNAMDRIKELAAERKHFRDLYNGEFEGHTNAQREIAELRRQIRVLEAWKAEAMSQVQS